MAVEDWLISESKKKLKSTNLKRPIYFFLGDFADGRDLSRPQSIIMPLEAFAPDTLTFTYPDSMASLAIAAQEDHQSHRKAYHGQLFTLQEIKDVVARFGMPGERWKSDPTMRYDKFVEVQVWDDGPIRRLLPAATRDALLDRRTCDGAV